MPFLPGWGTIEGSGRWSDVFFWAGFACLILLAVCILMSKVYGWRKDALVASRAQLITSLAEDLRNEKLRQLEFAARERAQTPTGEREPEPAMTQALEALSERTPPPSPQRPAVVPNAAAAPASSPPPPHEPERIARLQERPPRGLSDAQKKAMIGALSMFRGQKFAVLCIAGDDEGKSFAEALVSVLRGAGWDFPESAVAEATYASEPAGLSIMVNAAQALTPNLLRPTSNLVKVLADAGLMARTGALADPNVPRDVIEIRVGRNRNPT